MVSELTTTRLFKAVQSSASPTLWSQGVTLTRGSSQFVVSSLGEDECVIHVRTPGTPLSPKVMLWPQDEDWDCDCGDDLPCSHVAAAVILLKRGDLAPQASGNTDAVITTAAPEVNQIHYHLKRSPQGLNLERRIVGPGVDRALDTPLLAYTAGVSARRIKGPEVLASKTDYAVDQLLRSYHGTPLERARLEALFRTFEAEQKIFLDGESVQISDSRLAASYECVDEADGYRLRRLKNPLVVEVLPHGVALCLGNVLRLLNPKLLNAEESKLVDGEGSFWPANKENVLFSQVLPQLQKKISITISSLKRPQSVELPPEIHLTLEKEISPEGYSELSVLANLVYGQPPMAQLNPATFELTPIQGYRSERASENTVILRNPSLEKQLLQKLGRELNLQIGRRVLYRGFEAIDFVRKTKEWKPVGDGASAFTPELRQLDARVDVEEWKSGASSHYGLDVTFLSNGPEGPAELDFARVFKAYQQGSDYVPLLDGSWAQVPKDWLTRYGKKIQDFLVAREAGREVPTARLPELATLCDDLGTAYPDSVKHLKSMLENFRAIEDATLPRDLTATLRSYQRKGVNWLCFLRDAGLGAMLADDMGLGKTLQMICALRGKSLIVAPTSVIFNWAAEIAKFRPGLKVCLYYGAQRSIDETADVVLTSYGVLRIDQEFLRAQSWDSIVLDEAQTIKNPDSQVTRAAHSLSAPFKATLSGTPVENRLDDLWSQFAFINPGLLGTRNEFYEKYARLIVQGEAHAAIDLKARIKPFILRRLKREVAPELPPRTEVVLNCELDAQERATYESLLASTRQEVLQSLEGGGGSVIKALEVILRLRQACCHTALIPGMEAETSSKVNLLLDTLEESLSEGHRSLVFSQWTSFLDLIGDQLKRSGIRYSRIDGSTANRQALVNEFQREDGPPVMLISLKAGGVGLTLTAADHVFITDPWWNPAVEDQAADRAHRIGQENPVMIHRLVAKDTIEERIVALQESKKGLAKAVLDEGGAALSLTREDLLNLLR